MEVVVGGPAGQDPMQTTGQLGTLLLVPKCCLLICLEWWWGLVSSGVQNTKLAMFVKETNIIGNGWSQKTISKFTLKLQSFDQRELQQSQAALSNLTAKLIQFLPHVKHSPAPPAGRCVHDIT